MGFMMAGCVFCCGGAGVALGAFPGSACKQSQTPHQNCIWPKMYFFPVKSCDLQMEEERKKEVDKMRSVIAMLN